MKISPCEVDPHPISFEIAINILCDVFPPYDSERKHLASGTFGNPFRSL